MVIDLKKLYKVRGQIATHLKQLNNEIKQIEFSEIVNSVKSLNHSFCIIKYKLELPNVLVDNAFDIQFIDERFNEIDDNAKIRLFESVDEVIVYISTIIPEVDIEYSYKFLRMSMIDYKKTYKKHCFS